MARAIEPYLMPDPMQMEECEEGDEPMANDFHRIEQTFCFMVLREAFAGPDCYVSFERWLRMQLVRQNPLQPDLLVALGVPDKNRDVYDPHEEGKPPDMVAEFLSPSSLAADQIGKLEAYRLLGIREYWLFNPAGSFPLPYIQGWALHGELESEPLPEMADGSIASRVLPVRFIVRGGLLDVLDQSTGQPLSSKRTWELQLREETAARQRDIAAWQRDVAVLRREVAVLREETAARQREADALHRENVARLQAEWEVERLRAELDQLRREREK